MTQPFKWTFEVHDSTFTADCKKALSNPQSWMAEMSSTMEVLRACLVPLPPADELEAPPERDADYYLEMIEFEVDDIVYCAPKVHWPFVQTSDLEHQVEDMMAREIPKEIPCWLKGVDKSDTELYFKLIDLSLASTDHIPLSREEWLRILAYSTIWASALLRNTAITHLEKMVDSDEDRLSIGREHSIANWIKTVFRGLLSRQTPLTKREVEVLGISSSVHVVRLREAITRRKCSRPVVDSESARYLAESAVDNAMATITAGTPMMDRVGNAVEETRIAKEERVLEWLRAGYTKLAERSERLKSDEIHCMGLPLGCALVLSYAQGAYRTQWELKMARSSRKRWDSREYYDPGPVTASSFIDQAIAATIIGDPDFTASNQPGSSAARRVILAIKHRSQEWLSAACNEVICRESAMTDEEATSVGINSFVALAEGRESYWYGLRGTRRSEISIPSFKLITNEHESLNAAVQNDLDGWRFREAIQRESA